MYVLTYYPPLLKTKNNINLYDTYICLYEWLLLHKDFFSSSSNTNSTKIKPLLPLTTFCAATLALLPPSFFFLSFQSEWLSFDCKPDYGLLFIEWWWKKSWEAWEREYVKEGFPKRKKVKRSLLTVCQFSDTLQGKAYQWHFCCVCL